MDFATRPRRLRYWKRRNNFSANISISATTIVNNDVVVNQQAQTKPIPKAMTHGFPPGPNITRRCRDCHTAALGPDPVGEDGLDQQLQLNRPSIGLKSSNHIVTRRQKKRSSTLSHQSNDHHLMPPLRMSSPGLTSTLRQRCHPLDAGQLIIGAVPFKTVCTVVALTRPPAGVEAGRRAPTVTRWRTLSGRFESRCMTTKSRPRIDAPEIKVIDFRDPIIVNLERRYRCRKWMANVDNPRAEVTISPWCLYLLP